ncbi:MAG: iron ABC transporter permease [Flavobacteriales bacterium]|nr:iron ABC transporter permease [Flavobacteriales bacterium]
MSRRNLALLLGLLLVSGLLFLLHLVTGAVPLTVEEVVHALFGDGRNAVSARIVHEVRLPAACTAVLAGTGLSACGLLMQTLFRNPLAGPSVLGLSSGASLGVAVLMLARPLWAALWLPDEMAVVLGAFIGAMGVLLLIMLADRRMGDGTGLLIVGLMVGYLCGAVIDVLQVAGSEGALRGFVLWGMGSFQEVVGSKLGWMVIPVLLGLVVSLLLMKPLNAMLLGDAYARSLGIPVIGVRRTILWTAGVLAGTITAFCGPIAFLGLATPHVARALCRTSDHRVLLPTTIVMGGMLALLCGLLVKWPGLEGLPLNAVTSLLGAPIVVWVLWSGERWARTS